MDVEEVKEIVKESLGADEFDCVANNNPISRAVVGVDRSDIADMLFKTGIYSHSDFSCGEINKNGKEFLREAGCFSGSHVYANRFFVLSNMNTNYIFDNLTPMDISVMSKYKESLKGVVSS